MCIYLSVGVYMYALAHAYMHRSMYACMYARMYACMYVCASMHVRMNVCMHHQNFQDAPYGSATFANKTQDSPHRSTMLFKIFRTLRTGARLSQIKIKTLRTGARSCSKFSGRSARERDFHRNFEDAPHGSAIFLKIFRTLRTGARFFSKFSRRSARERDFDHKRTIWSGSVWYSIGIEINTWKIKILTMNPAKLIPGLD